MEFLKKHKTILIIVVVVAIGLILYNSLGGTEIASVDETLSSESVSSGAESDEILALLATLRAIEFDTSVFESPVFLGLVDFSVPLVPEPVGRPNPFAPIGR